jgi:DNA (cytosine-5)-methyltransferase 1
VYAGYLTIEARSELIQEKPEQEIESEQSFFFNEDKQVCRQIHFGDVVALECYQRAGRSKKADTSFHFSKLCKRRVEQSGSTMQRQVNYLDVFCGGGGLSLGTTDALRSLGFKARQVGAIDLDGIALSLFKSHFRPLFTSNSDVNEEISYTVDHTGRVEDFIARPIVKDPRLSQFSGRVDLLIGGPPCQGHSNLNNKTRRFDPRNLLYYTMPALALALEIPTVIIENVKSITASIEGVFEKSKAIFESNGYTVYDCVLNAADYGVAQNRQRHFCIATLADAGDIHGHLEILKTSKLSFDSVNSHLPKLGFQADFLETDSELSVENNRRISFLHENDLYDLPNSERPDCHKDGHTYPSVYGRIRANEPVGTITTGFGSPGRGRFIHPHDPRMITAREAARLQGFPDWYWEPCDALGIARGHLHKIIGDAVPPPLGQAIVLAAHKCFLK